MKLKNTTILVQVHKDYGDTIDQALSFSDNVIVYDDFSNLDFSKYDDKITIIHNTRFSGLYEKALMDSIDKVDTKYLVRINGGDSLLYLEEPKESFDIFYAKYNSEIRNHRMIKDYFKSSGTSIISGSVIPTYVYKELLDTYVGEYRQNYNDMKMKWKKFGKFCGDYLLNNKTGYQSDDVSCIFTFGMWGGQKAAWKIR